MESEIVRPDASRTIEGLRDTGYYFETAVADIIDNSVAANAENVDIRIEMDLDGAIHILIADDGDGMNSKALRDAMKYGSPERPDAASLGKFGLGLKTASTAICRKLSVLSRSSGDEDIRQATWDLDHVEKVNEWELLYPEPDKDAADYLNTIASGSSGTVVAWDQVDRFFLKDYQDPVGGHAQRALKKQIENLKFHISKTFQRFLDPADKRSGNVTIKVNRDPVLHWDPFCSDISDLVADETKAVELPDGSTADFTVRAYILPRYDEIEDEEQKKAARLSNATQGIYIYRENRLIHDADWLGMYQKEPHFTHCRVEFSFDHRLDDSFHVDIKKSRILIDPEIATFLKDTFLPGPRRAAEQRSRKGQRKKINEKAKGAHDTSDRGIASKAGGLTKAEFEVDPETGELIVTNKEGKTRTRIKILDPINPGHHHVEAVESLDDNVLWEPAYIKQNVAVRINTGHPYYSKVYVPNLSSGVLIQGMDSLLWSLCSAEFSTVNDASKRHFEELRFEVSRVLRRLVEDLPDPLEEDLDV